MIKQQQQVFVEENMSNLTTSASGEVSVSSSNNNKSELINSFYNHQQYYPPLQNQSQDHGQSLQPPSKKKRNLPGNPDPDAEVISLSPKSLLATNRFVCEICNKGFQRDQNLQLHRRGHNLPWKLKQRPKDEVVRKRVYVCPETSCVHHDPSRALGDLTGIKKHFCRKHGEKKWKCDKCSKRYAVQSDWKAHSKVCGTREYRCDCGTLFSRRDSFITHRAFCDALAEETARAITATNTLVDHVGPSTTSHFINLQQNDPLHAFPLKREQQHQSNMMNLPPWLACSPSSTIDLSSQSSSTSIFHHQQEHQLVFMQQQNQNPSISINPTNSGNSLSFGGSSLGGGPYHTQTSSPHMSATALLQKAAQMGATMSQTAGSPHQQLHHHLNHQGDHVSTTISCSHTTTTPTTTAGLFGLNLSSRDHTALIVNHGLSSFENKAATTTTDGSGLNQDPGPNPGPPSSSFLHDMMINSLSSSSSYDQNHADNTFGMGAMLGVSKKNTPFESFHQTLESRESKTISSGGHRAGNDGLTRDFLGLRPLSHNEILTMAGLGNCMTTNTTSSHGNHQNTH